MFKQILVIDNMSVITDVLSEILSGRGFDIQSATSNDEAVDYLSKVRFDLLLADVHMDGMSFSTFISTVRSLTHYQDTPIIAITGDPGSISVSDRSQIQGVLEKPFDSNVLIQLVQSVV